MPNEFIDYLIELVKLPSVSSDPSKKEACLKIADIIISKLKKLGAETKLIPNEVVDKNPIIFAKLGADPNKKTIMFYSHYDVQPALKEDGWETEPFVAVQKNGFLFARGISDDKGPIAVVYQAIKELKDNGELPINVYWLYEGEEECGSCGFEETVSKHYSFFGKVDGLLIMDVSWPKDETPSIVYGTRGIVYAFIEIFATKNDLHSGTSGIFREPMTDLIQLLSKLEDLEGNILIDGVNDSVRPLTNEEERLYDNYNFDVEEFKRNIEFTGKLYYETPKELLMNLWRYPSLTIHGIEGAFYGHGSKTVIPGKVIGKVSIRLVPDQNPEAIGVLFKEFVEKEFRKLNSPNTITFKVDCGDWWSGNPNNFLFKANKKAIKEFWKIDPVFTRVGGSVPIIPFLEKIFTAPAMGVTTGYAIGAHSQNERIKVKYLDGSKEVLKLMLQNMSFE